MTKDNWLVLFLISVIGVVGYIMLTKPDDEDSFHIPEEEWWG